MSAPEGGRLKYSCKYPGCSSKYYVQVSDPNYKNKHFHQFPYNPEICCVWRRICKNSSVKTTKHYYVCGDHFEKSDLLTCSKRLKWDASLYQIYPENLVEKKILLTIHKQPSFIRPATMKKNPSDDFEMENLHSTEGTQHLFEDPENCIEPSQFLNGGEYFEDSCSTFHLYFFWK